RTRCAAMSLPPNLPALDHVAIAVKDLDSAISVYRDVLGLTLHETEYVADQQVNVAIFGHGHGRIELICPTVADSGVAKFLEKRGEGLHHICIEVADIRATLAKLKAEGHPLIDQEPRVGAGGKLIAFLHPKAGRGVLIELSQTP
ncbi:MAG: methylmalonyl-CoA epimerase, partial [Myxococcales bacterium]